MQSRREIQLEYLTDLLELYDIDITKISPKFWTKTLEKNIDKLNEIYSELFNLKFMSGDKQQEDLLTAKLEKQADKVRTIVSKIMQQQSILKLGEGLKKFKENIPRSEMNKINKFIHSIKKDPKTKIILVGSYRREEETSNDVDILIASDKTNGLDIFVNKLKDKGFIVGDITKKPFKKKYMGYCKLGSNYPVRRLDIWFVPYSSYYSALVHLTGPKGVDIGLKKIAAKKGYKLNEYGLFKGTKRIPIKSERGIFDKLGVTYKSPKDR
jgi:DNA polymerase (family 10)